MPSSVSLVIANPNELIRAGLRAMLAKSAVTVVAEAVDGAGTIAACKKYSPDVLLVNANLPGGRDCFALLPKVREIAPKTNFIVLSIHDNPTYLARAKVAGAIDYLLESVTSQQLVAAVKNAAAGKSPGKDAGFAKISASMADQTHVPQKASRLTPREVQVLRHIAYGLSNDEIARSLGIALDTVKDHVQKMLLKLKATDRTQLAIWAIQQRLA